MTTDKQPRSNDYRKRIARPVFVRTFFADERFEADDEANAYSELVTDNGGEVLDIRPYTEDGWHNRVVTYRAANRIEATE